MPATAGLSHWLCVRSNTPSMSGRSYNTWLPVDCDMRLPPDATAGAHTRRTGKQAAGRQAGGQACLAACHPHMPCVWGCMHACVEPTYGQQRGFAVRQALDTRLPVGAFSPQEWCSSSTHQTHTHGLPAQPCCGMHVLVLVKDHSVAPAVHSCTCRSCRHKQH